MNVYTLSQQKKKLLWNSLDAGTSFLNAAVLSRKILVKAKYRIGTRHPDPGKTKLIGTSVSISHI